MAAPRVFISSTFYDLKQVRNNIGDFIYFHATYYVEDKDELQTFNSWYQIAGNIFFKKKW